MARLLLALAVAAAGCAAPAPDPSPTQEPTSTPTSTILLDPVASPPTSPGPAGPSPVAWGLPGRTLPGPTPKPSPQPKRRARSVAGWATYWDARGAAAGPALRRLLGPGYLGDRIRVWVEGRGPILLRITTSCACGPRHGTPTIVDLPLWALRALGLGTAQGVYHVKVQEVP